MGVFGLLLMLFLPLGFLGLVILGIILLVRAIQKPGESEGQQHTARCDNCGKKVAADWAICPYCGENLGEKA